MDIYKTVVDENVRKQQINKIMFWILFGVICTSLPTYLVIGYKIIVKLKFSYIDSIRDILLTVVAVCLNFMNMCVDNSKSIKYILRWIFGILMGILIIACWGLYLVVYFDINYNVKQQIENNMKILYYTALLIIVFCLFAGIIVEIVTNKNIEELNRADCNV